MLRHTTGWPGQRHDASAAPEHLAMHLVLCGDDQDGHPVVHKGQGTVLHLPGKDPLTVEQPT